MKIVVCIKQVPGTSKVDIDEKTGVLKRWGVESKMNPYDLVAIETALRIKELTQGTCTAITMGPESAKEICMEAFALGVDEAVLLSDRRFAGADVLATSLTLAAGIKAVVSDVDIIITGKQTTDGDTAQVGPEIAQRLNIPHIAWVEAIKDIEDKAIVVEYQLSHLQYQVKVNYPCLITVEKEIFVPRLPSYVLKKKKSMADIQVLTMDDCHSLLENQCGLKGSPTQVERMFAPKRNDEQIMIEESVDKSAQFLKQLLLKEKFWEESE